MPVPADSRELVHVRTPDWGRNGTHNPGNKMKATWLGHAGFFVEMPISKSTAAGKEVQASREANGPESWRQQGIGILIDAVFADRMSPVSFAGPKRFTPLPCQVHDLPDVDVLVFSHNHYDHMDHGTIKELLDDPRRKNEIHVFVPLNNKKWFLDAGFGLQDHQVTECDWWDSVDVQIKNKGSVRLTFLPSQHNSGRGIFDHGNTLWGSWAIEELLDVTVEESRKQESQTPSQVGKKLYFAGDTALKSASAPEVCPAFEQIGNTLGPFDLSLLPIGCYSPRAWMSNFHASPEDSMIIHELVKSRKSIGMHYGVIRGGLSAHYEDVREPPRLWREAAEKAGRWHTGECALSEVGETICV